MKNIIIAALAIFVPTGFASARMPAAEVVPKFYQLLVQEADPSPQDEAEFFGGSECEPIRLQLASKPGYVASQTPIWNYLRSHQDMFITKRNPPDRARLNIHISQPSTMMRIGKNKIPSDEVRVFVMFGTGTAATGQGRGISIGTFVIGTECLLDIGATMIASNSQLFFDYLYHDGKQEDKK